MVCARAAEELLSSEGKMDRSPVKSAAFKALKEESCLFASSRLAQLHASALLLF